MKFLPFEEFLTTAFTNLALPALGSAGMEVSNFIDFAPGRDIMVMKTETSHYDIDAQQGTTRQGACSHDPKITKRYTCEQHHEEHAT